MVGEPRSPQQQKAHATRTALLNAAKEKFTEEGFSNTSLASIVQAAGVTKGALFHHFKDKADLFYEVWLGLEQEMTETASEVARRTNRNPAEENPFAGFIAGCGVYFDFAQRRDYRRIVMIDGASVIGEFEWRRIEIALEMETISFGLNHLYEQRAIRTPPSKALVVMIQGAVHGAGYAIAREEEGIHKEDLMARIETTLRRL